MTEVSALIRATIFVRHLERATEFYRVLGLDETYYNGPLDDPSATSLLGLPLHFPYQVRILKRSGPNYGMVGLFALDPRAGVDTVPQPSGPARVGEVALVFYVPELEKTLAKLRAAGATWSPDPQEFRMPGIAQKQVCVRDCDGVLINLVEREPADQERTRPEAEFET